MYYSRKCRCSCSEKQKTNRADAVPAGGDARAAGSVLCGGRRGRGQGAVAAGAGHGTEGGARGGRADVVKRVVEACEQRARELGEGVVRLIGGRRTQGGT